MNCTAVTRCSGRMLSQPPCLSHRPVAPCAALGDERGVVTAPAGARQNPHATRQLRGGATVVRRRRSAAVPNAPRCCSAPWRLRGVTRAAVRRGGCVRVPRSGGREEGGRHFFAFSTTGGKQAQQRSHTAEMPEERARRTSAACECMLTWGFTWRSRGGYAAATWRLRGGHAAATRRRRGGHVTIMAVTPEEIGGFTFEKRVALSHGL